MTYPQEYTDYTPPKWEVGQEIWVDGRKAQITGDLGQDGDTHNYRAVFFPHESECGQWGDLID